MADINNRAFYSAIRDTKRFDQSEYESLMENVSQTRIERVADDWSEYLTKNSKNTIEKKEDIDDYRLNPSIIAVSSILDLADSGEIAEFIFGAKLYMALETAFGKSVEDVVMPIYPAIDAEAGWKEHPKKVEEMSGDARGEDLVWQKVDKYCVVDDTAYLATVKSGPRTLNESTTDSMKSDIAEHSEAWLEGTQERHSQVENLEVIIGLTYGTDNTTNNKEMRILLKLVEEGFEEVNRGRQPGVVVHPDNDDIKVHSKVGIDFWSLVANPRDPDTGEFAFLEMLLGFVKAADEAGEALIDKTEDNVSSLEETIDALDMPDSTYPGWVESKFDDDELVRLALILTLYYDEGFQEAKEGQDALTKF